MITASASLAQTRWSPFTSKEGGYAVVLPSKPVEEVKTGNSPCAWNACMDIGGRYAGTVSGSMNTTGNLAGFCAPVIGGFLLDRTGNDWNLLIYMMAGVAAFGALFWLFIDPVTPIEETSS